MEDPVFNPGTFLFRLLPVALEIQYVLESYNGEVAILDVKSWVELDVRRGELWCIVSCGIKHHLEQNVHWYL